MKRKKSKSESNGGDKTFMEFVEAARDFYLNDFPNPKRQDCPPSDMLSEIARSGKVPDDDLRRHLLGCSPCLKKFQAARESEIFPTVSDAKVSWFDFFRTPIFAAVLLLLTVGLFGLLIYIFLPLKNEEVARQNRTIETNKIPETLAPNAADLPENAETPVNVNKTVEKNVNIKKPVGKVSPQPIEKSKTSAEKTFNFDVAKASVLRGKNERQTTIYLLPDKQINLNIKLVENSPAGDYEISLFDPFKKPLIESRVIYSDGESLKTKIDLTNQSGKARLCVAPVDEVPDCFLVDIVREK